MKDFNCGGACNGTCVGNSIQCLCNTSTPALSWNITISYCFIDCDFYAGSGNCINNKCTGDKFERFQVSYINMTYSSIVSFSVNNTRDVHIMCLKNPGIVKLSVVYSLHIETLTKFN